MATSKANDPLGIPVESFEWFNKSYYQFHDTELSGIVKNAFHAIAIDEHRKSYQCTLWDPKEKPNQNVEQAWFSGAHANIGGGYANNPLSDISLRWMMEKAQNCGLALDQSKIPNLPQDVPPITDSYKDFLSDAYSKFEPRYFRTIGATTYGQELIDATVIQRTGFNHNYRPKNDVRAHLIGDITPVGRIRGQSGRRGFFSPGSHSTPQAGPHGARGTAAVVLTSSPILRSAQ